MNKTEFEARLKTIVLNSDDFLVGEGNSEPTFNIGSLKGVGNALYAVKLFSNKEIFIVWDLKRHRDVREDGKAGSSLGLTEKNWGNLPSGSDTFEPHYKELIKAYSGAFEKIYIVGLSHFEHFFQNYASYMRLNVDDDEIPNVAIENAKSIEWASEDERKKYSSSQYKREKWFRDEVLNAYEYQCAVCRCGTIEILEAAHEHGYEVCRTTQDYSEHGICLCANHHIMYDRGLININLKTRELEILEKEEEITSSAWYKDFDVKYSRKIKERKGNG